MNGERKHTTAYHEQVRSFDHRPLAELKAYQSLRQALSDIANEAENVTLADFLAAVCDMAATAPFADTCETCEKRGDDHMAWPHRVDREGSWLRCTYRCAHCQHVWKCGYSVDFTALI